MVLKKVLSVADINNKPIFRRFIQYAKGAIFFRLGKLLTILTDAYLGAILIYPASGNLQQ